MYLLLYQLFPNDHRPLVAPKHRKKAERFEHKENEKQKIVSMCFKSKIVMFCYYTVFT